MLRSGGASATGMTASVVAAGATGQGTSAPPSLPLSGNALGAAAAAAENTSAATATSAAAAATTGATITSVDFTTDLGSGELDDEAEDDWDVTSVATPLISAVPACAMASAPAALATGDDGDGDDDVDEGSMLISDSSSSSSRKDKDKDKDKEKASAESASPLQITVESSVTDVAAWLASLKPEFGIFEASVRANNIDGAAIFAPGATSARIMSAMGVRGTSPRFFVNRALAPLLDAHEHNMRAAAAQAALRERILASKVENPALEIAGSGQDSVDAPLISFMSARLIPPFETQDWKIILTGYLLRLRPLPYGQGLGNGKIYLFALRQHPISLRAHLENYESLNFCSGLSLRNARIVPLPKACFQVQSGNDTWCMQVDPEDSKVAEKWVLTLQQAALTYDKAMTMHTRKEKDGPTQARTTHSAQALRRVERNTSAEDCPAHPEAETESMSSS